MSVGVFKKRIIFTVIACVLMTLVCATCALFVGCGNDAPPAHADSFTVKYSAEVGGYIEGEREQEVERGKNGTTVTAVAENGYKFVQWSDGVATAERQETEVQSDISVTAEFEIISEITIHYTVGKGGRIAGENTQVVEWGGNADKVTAVADGGYKFVKWSDGVTTASRTDIGVTHGTSVLTIEAIFDYDNPIGIEDVLAFNINKNMSEYKVQARDKSIAEVEIPAYYNGLPVTEIAGSGFGNCKNLIHVYIPDSVVKIDSHAFANCVNLESVTGMNNVKIIRNHAFAKCIKLEALTLPSTLEYIGNEILLSSGCTVYVKKTESEMYALNPEWDSGRAESAQTVYIKD